MAAGSPTWLGGREFDARVGPWAGEADDLLETSGRIRLSVGGDADREAGRVGLDHLAVADHQSYVAGCGHRPVRAGEKHQVAWLNLGSGDLRAPGPLLLRGPRDENARGPVRHH